MKIKLRVSIGRSVESFFLMSVFFVIFSRSLFPEQDKMLTLKDAVDLTLKNNQDLEKYSNTVLSLKSTLDQKKKNFLPDLNLSGNYNKNYFKTADNTGTFLGDNSGTFSLSLSTNLVLFDGFFNISVKKQALSRYESSKHTYSRTEQQVIYNTILNYLDVVLSKELIRVGNENLKTQKLLLVRIKDFFNAGKKAAVDVHYQNAEIANSQYQLLNWENNLKLAKVKLMEGMGFATGLDFDVIAPGSEDPTKIVDLDKRDIFELAKKNRPDLRSAELSIDAATHGLRSAKSGLYPRVSLTGNISSRYSSVSHSYSFSDQLLSNNPSAAVGVSVSVPIFDKGATKNQVSQARLDLENSRIDFVKINNQIWGDLIQAESDYRTGLRQVEVAKAKLAYSKIAFESMTERYHVNASTITELSQTRAQYLQSQYDQVDAGLNLYRQGITLLYQVGDIKKILALIK